MALVLSSACISVTGISGTIRMRIPGTFQGMEFDHGEPISGRFFKNTNVWVDSGAPGDRVHSFRIEDDQEILAEIPDPENEGHMLSERFSAYPIIGYFDEGEATDPALNGYFIPVNGFVQINSIDQNGIQFIPSGFSVCGDYVSGDGESITVRANFTWGRWQ